ncbi:segregation and condensation protein B [Paenibacillus larvae subsp. pulvifaciens]|nr:segregation and condensation protein B [Paenibacillus larvae subsp. pulvifaciens]AQZ49022.1 segregation and condensation protein B [Paenibacillus larvae subsp. pulvifaciens]MBH0340881.1 segregation and condensation protein B [Paenibacillus larvae]
MFEIQGTGYTLKFNKQRIKTVELMTKRSVMAEISNNNGVLSMQTLEALFAISLVEEKANIPVKQSKAIEIFDKVMEENGLLTLNNAVIEKLQEDLGFMFQ